jgi:type III secretory pathway component EscV
MKTYKFHFRIEREAGLKSEAGETQIGAAYTEIGFEAKKKLKNRELEEVISRLRKELSEQLGIKVWHIISISKKEYMKRLNES